MSTPTKPLVSLTIAQKVEIIHELENQSTPQCLAKRYGVSPATISRIKRNQNEILQASVACQSLKRVRPQMYEEVDKYLMEWFEQARAKNLIITDAILQAQAQSYGKQLKAVRFKGSDRWIRNFKIRHGIRSLSLQGEAASVDGKTVEDYRESFKEWAKEFEPRNVFNLDETALFYKLLPNRTLCHQAKAKGAKSNKDRVSLAFCVSFTGEKLLPLVIGKAAKPRCLRDLDLNKIGVRYTNSFKSWMTSAIFQEYLKDLNKKMVKEKRKILLLIDNAPSHIVGEELTNITIKFLPKDTTSVLQPLDQGIIRSFKAYYKMALIKHLIAVGNNTPETMRRINLGVVVHWISDAWKKVSEMTITNCFKKTKLFDQKAELLITDTAEGELQAQLTTVNATVSAEEYLNTDEIDLSYNCSEEKLSQEVYESVSTFEGEDENDEEEFTEKPRALEGVSIERTQSHVGELRLMLSFATTPTLMQTYGKIIFELARNTEQLLKQAKLDFGPAEPADSSIIHPQK